MRFRFGPDSYVVSSVDEVIGAGLSIVERSFRFPRPVFVDQLLLIPLTGLRADMAKLRIRIQDETSADLISDGIGGHEASALELCGLTPLPGGPIFEDLVLVRPYDLQRPVMAGDVWYFTLENVSAGPIRPELVLGFKEGVT